MTDRYSAVTMEFHVSRAARERYRFEEPWFTITGNVVLADYAATRRLAQRMTEARNAVGHPERAVHAGQLHAMGLIDEILHYVVGLYRQQGNPEALGRALARLEQRLGRSRLDDTLRRFTDAFPPLGVYRGNLGVEGYLEGRTAGVAHREMALEELLMLWIAN